MASVPAPVEQPHSLSKAPTGIPGLDQMTGGGLPRGRPTLVCGPAGCGKTLLAMEFLVRGIQEHGEAGVFVAFEETVEDLVANVASLGFDLPKHVEDGRLVLDHIMVDRGDFAEAGEWDLEGLFLRLGASIDEMGCDQAQGFLFTQPLTAELAPRRCATGPGDGARRDRSVNRGPPRAGGGYACRRGASGMDLTSVAKQLLEPVAANRSFGVEVVGAADGAGVVRLDVDPAFTNVIGSLHASGVVTLVDAAGLAAMIGAGEDASAFDGVLPLGRQSRIDFLAPARGRLTARCELASGAVAELRSLFAGTTDRLRLTTVAGIVDDEGTTVATGGFDWSLRRSPPQAATG